MSYCGRRAVGQRARAGGALQGCGAEWERGRRAWGCESGVATCAGRRRAERAHVGRETHAQTVLSPAHAVQGQGRGAERVCGQHARIGCCRRRGRAPCRTRGARTRACRLRTSWTRRERVSKGTCRHGAGHRECRRLGDFVPFLSIGFYPACWRAHVLVTLSFLWQPPVYGLWLWWPAGVQMSQTKKAQRRKVRRCVALTVAQTASRRRQRAQLLLPHSSSFSAAPASSSASSGGESGLQPEWSPIHGDVSSHGPQLSLWGCVT